MKQITLIMLGVMALGQSYAQTNYPLNIPGCIARWDFSHNGAAISSITDASGNNHHATAYNIIPVNGYRNASNKAMKFNGTSSYGLVSHNSSLTPGAMTIVSLVRFDDFNSNLCQGNQIISKGYPNFITGCYGISISDNTYDLGNCNSFNPAYMQVNAQYGTLSAPGPSGQYVQSSKWYMIAFTYDANSAKVYQGLIDSNSHNTNLQPVHSMVTGATMGANTQDISIGKHLNPNYPYYLNGVIDEIAMFNRALTTAEIQKVYDYLWGKVFLAPAFNQNVFCTGQSFNLPYEVADNYPANNVFTAQLSDASGSFSNPVTIGTATAHQSGSILCTIPAGTAYGTGYRIRIVPSHAAFKSDDNGFNITIHPVSAMGVGISVNPGTVYTPGQQYVFTASVTNGGANPQFQWRKNGVDIPGATSVSYTTSSLAAQDVISVAVRRYNDICAYADTAVQSVRMIPTGVAHISNALSDIELFPNPVRSTLTITGLANAGSNTLSVSILNNIGQVVYHEDIPALRGVNEYHIPMPEALADGHYFLKVQTESAAKMLRFMLQR